MAPLRALLGRAPGDPRGPRALAAEALLLGEGPLLAAAAAAEAAAAAGAGAAPGPGLAAPVPTGELRVRVEAHLAAAVAPRARSGLGLYAALQEADHVSSGLPALDAVLGGGFRQGQVTEQSALRFRMVLPFWSLAGQCSGTHASCGFS